jgi:glycosyltransferase involved in cell wall biosynthesis
MDIVFVDTTITTPPTGGAHTFLVDIGQCLVVRGDRVAVVTQPGPDESLVKALRMAGVEVYMDLWRNTHLPEQRAKRLAQWVNERNPDVYTVSASADVGWLALPQLSVDIATITIAHNDSSSFYEPITHYHPFVDIAVTVSSEILGKTIEAGVSKERARAIAYGVAPISRAELEQRLSSHDGNALQIAYVGRIVQAQKRIMELVPLVRSLKARGIQFQLHLVGDGSHRVQLAEAFAAAGLSEFVQFWGWQSSAEVKKLLRRMDVFVLLSEYEGLPVALLEGMAHGLAPVVSRIASGNTEIINHGENGYLVEVGDIEGFAARLELLANDRSLLGKIQRAAWLTSQDYTLPIMVERYLKCFAEARESGFSREFRRQAGGAYPIMRSCVSRYPVWLRKIKYHLTDLANDAPFTRPGKPTN